MNWDTIFLGVSALGVFILALAKAVQIITDLFWEDDDS